MQPDLKTQLTAIVNAVTFSAAGDVTFAGRASSYAAPATDSGLGPSGNPRVAALQQLFYGYCYCRHFAGVPAALPDTAPPGEGLQASELIQALSAANTSQDHWSAGWQLMQTLPNGQIVAVKGSMTRTVWPGEFHGHGPPGVQIAAGGGISLFAPRESRTSQPGFYFAFGEALADQQEDFGILRLYWNVTVEGAPSLLGIITERFNRFAIPFRFKCLEMPDLFDRSDAAVLYIAKRHYRIAAAILPDMVSAIRAQLKPHTPLFSKHLASGLALAEDPRTGESFGMNRCRLLAEAVCRAQEQGGSSAEARLLEIERSFEAAGLSLDRPWLNAGSRDQYPFEESRAA
jgi:hypothetical protein